MRPLPALVALFLAAVPAFAHAAAPDTYALDPVHTRVLFAISHDGYSQSLGTVSGSHGNLQFDPGDWSAAQLDVSVPLQQLELGDPKWNDAALKILDAKKFPAAHFVSTRVEQIDAQHAHVFGDLTLHGVTREAELDVTFNQLKRIALPPFHRIAGFSATTTIKRSDFGIDAWKSMIGDEVQLRLEVEAIRHHGDSNEPESTPTETATP